jgi:LPS export ABC transporter protein LptC
MHWQQRARLAIAAFVIVFAGLVVFMLRQRSTVVPPSNIVVPADDNTVVSSQGAIEHSVFDKGRLRFKIQGKDHKVFRSGHMEIQSAVVTVPDRDNKGTVTISADKAVVQAPPNNVNELQNATFSGNVKLTNDKGVVVTAAEASYQEATGVVTVPGAVKFSRGRMTGDGLGATYDKKRDVLWILDRAHVTVAPDAAGGGAAEAHAGTMGMARADNYIKMTKNAQIVAEGRTTVGDEITAILNDGGETIRKLEIRNNSRITGSGPSAQNMSARDIDLSYAPDGRTLQSARLMENAAVELPGDAGAPSRRIAGKTIDLGMSPDGATLTSLTSNEGVSVDLPAAGDAPAKNIRAASLNASGPAGAGLQTATFTGSVQYTETRAARGSLAAIDRTARANRLVIATKPGLGEIEQADFHGNFNMREVAPARGPDPRGADRRGSNPRGADQRGSNPRGADQRGSNPRGADRGSKSPNADQGGSAPGTRQITAEAPRALYYVNRDLIELMPEAGEPGPTPYVNDGRMRVSARNIKLVPSTQKLSADTEVQSTMQPEQRAERTDGGRAAQPATGDRQGQLPAILKKDKPVTVVANRLEYDGDAEAVYTGKARLWQEQSKIDADTIILNNRTGNLTARTNVRTTMPLEDTDPKTKERKITETVAEANLLEYDDNTRVAVYTGTPEKRAHMKGVGGDVHANRIDVFLSEDGGRLERAVAVDKVSVEDGLRRALGQRLVYTADDDTYVMTGSPVEAYEQESPNSCKVTLATTLTFKRAVGSIRAETTGLVPVTTKTVPSACPAERRD